MKKVTRRLFLWMVFLSFFGAMQAQTSLVIHGTVSNLNNQPIAGKMVSIVVDSVFGPSSPFYYSGQVTTGMNGGYTDTVLLPQGANFAMVRTAVIDCYNILHHNFQTVIPPATLPSMDFNICDSVMTSGCNAFFTAGVSPNNLQVHFSDYSAASPGSTITSWFWSFGDSTTSTLQNPVHTYAQPGNYMACLTITDGTNCINSFCDPVLVTGPSSGSCISSFSYTPVPGTTDIIFNNNSAVLNYSPATHQVYYFWNFGDGNMDTLNSTQPFIHNYLQPGGYWVTLGVAVVHTTTNTVVCLDSWSTMITVGGTPPPPIHDVFGMLFANNGAAGPSEVYLIQYDSLTGILTAVDTTYSIDSAGVTLYHFGNVTPGLYLVKAAMLPSNPDYASNMPTYHVSSLFWSQGTTVDATINTVNQANVNFLQGINPGGPGFIGGSVSQGANKGSGDPIEGVQVMLLDMGNGDAPVAYTYTDASGSFAFANIPFGTYKVYAEMINKATQPVVIIVDQAHPSSSMIQIVVGSSLISWIDEQKEFESGTVDGLFPNPAGDVCNLSLHLNASLLITVELFDVSGKRIQKIETQLGAGHSHIAIPTVSLGSGIYQVMISSDRGDSATRRLIKK